MIEECVGLREQSGRNVGESAEPSPARAERRRDGGERVPSLLAAMAKRIELALRERSGERLPPQRLELRPSFGTDVLALELLFDPHEPVGVVELRDEALRMLREPAAVILPGPIVDLQVSIERGAPHAEPLLRVVLDARVLERGVELLVAHLRELRADSEVGDLEILQVAFQVEGDLVCALGRGEGAWHGRGRTLATVDRASARGAPMRTPY